MSMHKLILVAVTAILLCGVMLHAQTPAITTGGTVNAADYSRDFAPGSIISIFGTNLATRAEGATTVPLPTTLADATSVVITGFTTQALPLFYVSPTQINTQLPYGLAAGSTVQIQVRTAAGNSATDTITVQAQAPKIFTINFSGSGSGVITSSSFHVTTQANPAKPGDDIILWVSGLGETTPAVVAGNAAPGPDTGLAAVTGVTVTIGGADAKVTWAGAAPGYSGLYQINAKAPFNIATGPLDVQVSLGTAKSQTKTTVAYRALGFYNAVLGGKAVTGQSPTGADTLAFRQSDTLTWGTPGLNAWTKMAASTQVDSTVTGLALTLKNGATVVFDNNGIDDKSGAAFYSNAGGGADSAKPGMANLYSMSNYFPLTFATYVKLSQATSISELDGYFDPIGSAQQPFDPNNPYVKYRFNIWSSSSALPKENGTFAGDVFSSDNAAGTFTIGKSAVSRISSTGGMTADIWKLSFVPATPISLPAGEYWISHDASVRATAAASSTAASITVSELANIIRMQPHSSNTTRFSFFGREMVYQDSWVLPFPVTVRPDSPITTSIF